MYNIVTVAVFLVTTTSDATKTFCDITANNISERKRNLG